MKTLLSVCLIVKDEAQHLAACLQSLQAIADQIIVVDTGSGDQSREIARHFGSQVFEHAWQDDFALARNQSLAYAQSEWILVIDADETLDADSAEQIRKRLLLLQPALWSAQIINYGEDQGQYIFPVVRLFPNQPHLRYCNAFHEILTDLKAQLPICHTDWLTIHHRGYQDSPQRRSKHQRNHRILQGLLTQEPNNPLWHIHLANYLYNHGQEMAVTWRHYQTALRLAEQTPGFKKNPTYQSCLTELLWVCYQQEQTQMGLLLAKSQQEWCQHLPEYWYHQGLLQRQSTDYAAAIQSFEVCLRFQPSQLTGIRYQLAHLRQFPLFQIALCYRGWLHHPETGNKQRAILKSLCQQAIQAALADQALPLEQSLIWLLETLDNPGKLESFLPDDLHQTDASQNAQEVLVLLAQVDSGQLNQAQVFAQARREFQAPVDFKSTLLLKTYAFRFQNLEALLLLSELQQAAQDLAAAEQSLIEGLLQHPFAPSLHQAIQNLHLSQKPNHDANDLIAGF